MGGEKRRVPEHKQRRKPSSQTTNGKIGSRQSKEKPTNSEQKNST